MKIDKILIGGKIDIIERNLKFLNDYKNVEKEKFTTSYKDIQAVKFSIFEIIEAFIDFASHIISTKGFERAESYSEMFEILGNNNMIDVNLSKKLSDMAKFRNFLIHSYNKIDNLKILDYISKDLKAIESFVMYVLKIT
ncbi:MAG: type VII toxin-antitoxin system HepT family RNase toxin [Candidatus Helarchaeota archaeon]